MATLGFCLYLPHRFPARQATIAIDLQTSGGNSLQVFVNDLTVPPLTHGLAPGVRRTYTFQIADDVLLLRIDPTDAAGVIVEIHAVEVMDASGSRVRFEPADLLKWNRAGVVKVPGDTPAFRFRTASDDPMLWTTPNLVLSQDTPGWLRPVVRRLRSPDFLLTASLAGWVAWVVVGVGQGRWAYLPITAAAVASVFWLVPLVVSLPGRPPPVNVAVGRAALMGLSLQARQMAVLVAVVATALVGMAAAFVEQRWRRRDREEDSSFKAMPSVAGERQRTLWVAVACVIVAASLLPDLRGLFDTARLQIYSPNWDQDNLLYWAYLVSRGAIPYRDFWYPYAGFFVFNRPAPVGALLKAAYETVVFCLFALVFYRASSRRLGPTIAATALLLLGHRSGAFPELRRHLLTVDVLLSFIGIRAAVAALWSGYALFWLACSLALFFEPAQFLYAAPGMAVVAAFDALDRQGARQPPLPSLLVRALGVPALGAAAYLAWLHHRGQLEGFLTFHLALGDAVAYSALPADLAAYAHSPHSVAFLVLVAAPLLVGVGLFERSRRPRGDTLAGSLLIGVGTVAIMMLQKFLVRPNQKQLLYLVPLGALSAILVVRARRSAADRVVIGCFLGATTAALVLNGGAMSLVKGVLGAPGRLASGLSVLAHTPALTEARQMAFTEERLVRFADERALARRLTTLNGGPPEVFVLSDAPILYVLLDRVVYHANLYNASPIYEQRRIVDWLSSREVPYVVFDPSALTSDGFAKAVRAPLVFARVVQDYVPLGREGRFEITRRRRPDEPIALKYWREKLGPSVFLGHLPRLSDVGGVRPCAEPDAPCQEVLQVMFTANTVTRVSVPIEIQGLRYRVDFEALPGVTRYYCNLDRIWFWSAARAAGIRARLATERMAPTVVAGIVSKTVRPNILY